METRGKRVSWPKEHSGSARACALSLFSRKIPPGVEDFPKSAKWRCSLLAAETPLREVERPWRKSPPPRCQLPE